MSFVLADRAYVWFNVASASDSFWMVGLVPIRVGWKGVEGIDGDNDVIMAITIPSNLLRLQEKRKNLCNTNCILNLDLRHHTDIIQTQSIASRTTCTYDNEESTHFANFRFSRPSNLRIFSFNSHFRKQVRVCLIHFELASLFVYTNVTCIHHTVRISQIASKKQNEQQTTSPGCSLFVNTF